MGSLRAGGQANKKTTNEESREGGGRGGMKGSWGAFLSHSLMDRF